MSVDALSPITPARVKALVIPIGQIKKSKFTGFVERLRQEHVVRLGDVSPDGRPHRTMFSPLAFPEGLVLYELSASHPPLSHLELAPFEVYRLPLLVLGIADGAHSLDRVEKSLTNIQASYDDRPFASGLDAMTGSLTELRQKYASALVHCILVFDYSEKSAILPEGIIPVPPLSQSRITTVKTIMCDLTSLLLAGMATYAKTILDLQTVPTPRGDAGGTLNGVASALPAHVGGVSRPNSAAERSRSYSPRGDGRVGHQITMPAHVSSTAELRASSTDSRDASPAPVRCTPATTFEEIKGDAGTASPQRILSRDRAGAGSQERNSTSASGSGALGERERSRGKARIGVVIGALYLLAGRWPDALKELVQSVTISRANSDYVWQAKAMDYLVVCLLMCSWAGMDFRIPDGLRPGAERASTGLNKPSKHPPSSSQHDITLPGSTDPEKRALTLQSFADLLPDIIKNIVDLYGRAWTFTEDRISAVSFYHSTIRFAKILTALHLSRGCLNSDVLRHLVKHRALSPESSTQLGFARFSSKSEIVTLLSRAYPNPSLESSLSVSDRTATLAASAVVLSELGYYRKQALIFKDMISSLLPALVQARKDGAAEMGVHPAASLVSLNLIAGSNSTGFHNTDCDDVRKGVEAFLALVCQHFSITLDDQTSKVEEHQSNEERSAASKPVDAVSSALQLAIINAHGAQDLKIDILRSCINICEAMPDLAGALHCSATLLRVAAPGTAPGPESTNGSPALVIEEQVQLANNISRTLDAAQRLGLSHPEADYWDEFLIRGIEVTDAIQSHSLIPHAKSELELAEKTEGDKKQNPFIYNPFLKPKTPSTIDRVLIANEEAIFEVILQNLYDFELPVESIMLESAGVQLDCRPQMTTIGPYRTQTMLIFATPRHQGTLTITSCKVKVRGCRVRTFLVFSQPWALKADVKGRNLQIPNAAKTVGPQLVNGQTSKSKPTQPLISPTGTSLALKVIKSQPLAVLKFISLPQPVIMLHKGETQRFQVTLQNVSSTTPVDFLLLSFADSTEAQLQDELANTKLSASKLYELEYRSVQMAPFRWHKANQYGDVQIRPGGEASLAIEVFGRSELTYGIIQVDYGFLGVTRAEVERHFYTRQICFPINVTVNPTIDLVYSEILPIVEDLRQEMPSSLRDVFQGLEQDGEDVTSVTSPLKLGSKSQTSSGRSGLRKSLSLNCILLLDFRNSCSSTMTITLQVDRSMSSAGQARSNLSQTIYANASTRIPIPLPRVYLPSLTAHAPIPSLNKINKRQFVVSAIKTSPEAERTAREAFWYREEILKRISATWKEESTGRSGTVNLRAMKLSLKMIEIYKLDDIAISMSVTSATSSSSVSEPAPETISQITHQKYQAPTSTFLSLHTTLYNRSPSPIRPLLRLQPTLANQPPKVALNLHKKLLVNGVLQRALPLLKPNETLEVETAFIILSQGIYEWGAVVEEVLPQRAKWEEHKEPRSRERARTGELDLEIEEGGRRRRRRKWVAERSCVVVARDEVGMEG